MHAAQVSFIQIRSNGVYVKRWEWVQFKMYRVYVKRYLSGGWVWFSCLEGQPFLPGKARKAWRGGRSREKEYYVHHKKEDAFALLLTVAVSKGITASGLISSPTQISNFDHNVPEYTV